MIAANPDSVPENYKIYECSNCGNRIASPGKPEIDCYECESVDVTNKNVAEEKTE